MEAAIKRYQEHTLQSHIDPASRVFFATQGDVFRVDRLAPELVLVPIQAIRQWMA